MMPSLKLSSILILGLWVSCGHPIEKPPVAETYSDPVGRLLDLVDQDDIETREAARAALIQLGPDALPRLITERDRLPSSALSSHLQQVIEILEEQDLLVRRIGRPPLMSLVLKNAPLGRVRAELESASGVLVSLDGLPENLEVTVEIEHQPIWVAVDDVCRRQGRIRPIWSEAGVTLVPGDFIESPHVDWNVGPIPMGRFLLEYSVETREWLKLPALGIRPRLLLSPARRLFHVSLFLDDICDAGGSSLSLDEDGSCFIGNSTVPSGPALLHLQHLLYEIRRPITREIARTRGSIYFHVYHGTRRRVLADRLDQETNFRDPDSGHTLHLMEVHRGPGELKVKYRTLYGYVDPKRIDGIDGLRLVSKTGRHLLPVEAEHCSGGGSMGMEDWYTEARFVTTPGEDWASLELLEPEDTISTFKVEFDFPTLPVR